MGEHFDRFALRYPAAVICGLALLLCHGAVRGGPLAVLAPQCPSPWELSKLGFWPVLAAWGLTSRLGQERRALVRDLPAAVLVPLGMTLACWALVAAGGYGAVSLGIWAALLAAGMALCPDGERHPGLWRALALLLAGLYTVLTFFPPDWGPFVDPLG